VFKFKKVYDALLMYPTFATFVPTVRANKLELFRFFKKIF